MEKTEEEILDKIYQKSDSNFGHTLKFTQQEAIEAMEEFASQSIPSKERRKLCDELIEWLTFCSTPRSLETTDLSHNFIDHLRERLDAIAELSAPDKPETKPLRYFKCVDCGTKFEFNGFPYWLPIAEGHVSPNDHKMCKTKYIEITKEEYEKQ
jgi:hypothetical protein